MGIAVAVACLLGGASDARADTRALDKAREALDQLDYAAAKEALAEALASGGNGPEELVEIYRMTGTVAASLGDAKAATDAFKRLLALRPKATLPAGTSPKISRPFSVAADFFKKNRPLQVRTETAAQPPVAKIIVDSDPLAMVAGAKVAVVVDGARERTLEGKGKGKIEVELPRGKRIDLRIGVVDEHGNRLVELGSREVPIVITGAELPGQQQQTTSAGGPTGERGGGGGKEKLAVTAAAQPRPPRPWYFRWWLWTGGAVAFGGATGYFAYRAHSEANELQALFEASSSHRVGESTDLESRARRDVLITNIGLGFTVALAGAAAFLYLTEPRGAETRKTVTIAPALVEGGGAFIVRGGF
jgi:hypothetical protein